MAKLRLSDKRAKWVEQFQPKQLKGGVLSHSVSIEARMTAKLHRAIDTMAKETERAVKELFEADNYAGNYGMDANIGSQARIVINSLTDRFSKMFAGISSPIAETMIDEVDKNSAATLKSSLVDVAGHMQFSTDILTGELRETLTAATNEAANLIKRVPSEYLDSIGSSIYRAIATGNGLADIYPVLDKQKIIVKNWTKNVSADQTRKAYNGLQEGRMSALGLNHYEWVHSGGSNHPNEYHVNELNGNVYSLEDPPIIDAKTGTRGKPGDWYNCRCRMRVVLKFDDE